MLKLTFRWIVRCGAAGALLIIFGCSSSSKSYSLVAVLTAMGAQQRIVMGTIDVVGSTCSVNILTLDSDKPWSPTCAVNQDQATHKAFMIDGQEVDLAAAADGSFTISNTPSLTLPVATSSVAAATTAAAAATAKPAATSKIKTKSGAKATASATATTAPAASTAATPAVATGQAFPTTWKQTLYPGHQKLAAQNLGYLVESAGIDINGSTCELNVIFKVKYPPYHLYCSVTTDPQGDFMLYFNPYIVAKAASSGSYNILMASEGQSISGIVWDSHGFDAWTPAVPPSWRVAKNQ